MTDGWVRKGDCNHCGWCCRYEVVVRVINEVAPDPDYFRVRKHQVFPDGKARGLAYVGLRCPQFVEDSNGNKGGACKIYETRPKTCQDFPVSPGQVEDIPCSYWFERRLEDGTVEVRGGMESPYPTSQLYGISRRLDDKP